MFSEKVSRGIFKVIPESRPASSVGDSRHGRGRSRPSRRRRGSVAQHSIARLRNGLIERQLASLFFPHLFYLLSIYLFIIARLDAKEPTTTPKHYSGCLKSGLAKERV